MFSNVVVLKIVFKIFGKTPSNFLQNFNKAAPNLSISCWRNHKKTRRNSPQIYIFLKDSCHSKTCLWQNTKEDILRYASVILWKLQWKSLKVDVVWLPTFFFFFKKKPGFCRSKKVKQVWNDIRVYKWWRKYHFGGDFPFNNMILYHVYSRTVYKT